MQRATNDRPRKASAARSVQTNRRDAIPVQPRTAKPYLRTRLAERARLAANRGKPKFSGVIALS